eukprot:m.29741 g.29741  ORF g.29741 m.29741 type:complete len:72 (-) comp8132_c0_seq2:400-615(-)
MLFVGKLTIEFNTSLLKGDKVVLQDIPPVVGNAGGSQLYVQTNATLFCMEPARVWDHGLDFVIIPMPFNLK